MRKLPARYGGLIAPLMLSVIMTCIVSLVSTLRGVGFAPGLVQIWMTAWGVSLAIAFPVALFVVPLARRAAAAVVEADKEPAHLCSRCRGELPP